MSITAEDSKAIIARIDAEIAKLQSAKEVLLGLSSVAAPVAAPIPEPARVAAPKATPVKEPVIGSDQESLFARLSQLQAKINTITEQERASRLPAGFYLWSAMSPCCAVEPGEVVTVDMPHSPGFKAMRMPFCS